MIRCIINPGAGPVDGCNLDDARVNMQAFIKELDLDPPPYPILLSERFRDGRWTWQLTGEAGRICEVAMPGLPLGQVRCDIGLGVPRLYVDGSSWWWEYAIDIARGKLTGGTDGR